MEKKKAGLDTEPYCDVCKKKGKKECPYGGSRKMCVGFKAR